MADASRNANWFVHRWRISLRGTQLVSQLAERLVLGSLAFSAKFSTSTPALHSGLLCRLFQRNEL
jgi:hypothetical protein